MKASLFLLSLLNLPNSCTQAINVILSKLSVEVQDEAIFNGQPPTESAHLIWTRIVDLYEKSKCDEVYECESMEGVPIFSPCNEEVSRN
jgi:hypothetical protein